MHSTISCSDPSVLSNIDSPILSYPHYSCTNSTELSCIDLIKLEPIVLPCTDTTKLYFN